MKWFNEYLFLGIAGAVALVILGLLIWLIRERSKFRKDIQILSDYITRNNRDISGLCSAAITIDQRLTENEEALKNIQAKITDVKPAEPTNQPYRSVIQKVQGGAGVAELMQNFGLSRDEATLLIRLHGQKNAYE